MEKSVRRRASLVCRRLLRPRLVTLCGLALALLVPTALAATEVDIYVSSFELAVGEPLIVQFTVRDAAPSDTSFSVSDVPPSFAEASSRKERGTAVSGTVITREWIPSLPGNYAIGPFLISVKDDEVTMPPVYVTVIAPKETEFAELRWVIAEGQARMGQAKRLTLEGFFAGKAGALTCPAPENALLAPVAPESEAIGPGWVAVASWDWTPLAEGRQMLPTAILEYTTDSGVSRKLVSQPAFVSVTGSSISTSPPPADSGLLKRAFAESKTPQAGGSGDKRDVARPEGLPDETAVFGWGPGSYAPVLHSLRRSEYTRLFPSRWRESRMRVEAALELGPTLTVPPAGWKRVSVVGSVLLASLAFFLRLGSARIRAFRALSAVLFPCALALAFFAVAIYTRDLKSAGVSSGGDLLHIPEFNSTVVERLAEGEAVRILRTAGDWLFVETGSSLRGWVSDAQILQYTTTE